MKNNIKQMKILLQRPKFWITTLFLILLSLGPLVWYFIKPLTNFETDTIFHFHRLRGLSNYLTSPVNFTNFGHQGKIINIMYPPLTLLPTLIIKFFTQNEFAHWYFTWIYVNLIVTFSAFITFWKWSKNYFATLIATILWSLLLAHVILIYEHGAISNTLCLAFYPVVFYGAYKLFFENEKRWYVLSIALTLVLYTHILSALVLIMGLTILFILSIIFKKMTLKRFKYVIIALLTFTFLSLIIVLPMYEQYKAYKLSSALIVYKISGDNPMNFLTGSFINRSIGLVNMLCLIIVIFNYKKMQKFEISAFICALILLFLALNFGEWKILKHTPLIQLQAPMYRLGSVVELLIIIIILRLLTNKQTIWNINLQNNKNQFLIIAILTLFVAFNTTIGLSNRLGVRFNAWNKMSTKITWTDARFKNKLNNYQYRDYTNLAYIQQKTKKQKMLRDNFSLNEKIIKVNPNVSSNNYEFNLKNNQPNSILLVPISVYKGLNITLNDNYVKPVVSKQGTLKIALKDVKNYHIKLWYNWTLLARISQIVSLLSWIILLIYLQKSKR